jgi:hypothetical protein
MTLTGIDKVTEVVTHLLTSDRFLKQNSVAELAKNFKINSSNAVLG